MWDPSLQGHLVGRRALRHRPRVTRRRARAKARRDIAQPVLAPGRAEARPAERPGALRPAVPLAWPRAGGAVIFMPPYVCFGAENR